jgi:hypothetical protein
VPTPRDVHRAGTTVMSVLLVVLGVAILAVTIAGGGGPLAVGVLLGLAFAGTGAGRLWLSRRAG